MIKLSDSRGNFTKLLAFSVHYQWRS